jgi:hypothetical protein
MGKREYVSMLQTPPFDFIPSDETPLLGYTCIQEDHLKIWQFYTLLFAKYTKGYSHVLSPRGAKLFLVRSSHDHSFRLRPARSTMPKDDPLCYCDKGAIVC